MIEPREPLRVHLFSLQPGEMFRVSGKSYRVVIGPGKSTEDGPPLAFEDSGSRPVPGSEVAIRNGGSYFVLPIPSPVAAGKGGGP